MQKLANKPIINLINLLLKNYYSKEELAMILDIKINTLSRYFTIIKQCGFRLKKIDNKYRIFAFKNLIKFNKLEVSMLAHILASGKTFFSDKTYGKLKNVFQEVIYFSDDDNFKELSEKLDFFTSVISSYKYKDKVVKFQKYINSNVTLEIDTVSFGKMLLKPIKLSWGMDSVYFVFEDIKLKETKEMLPNDIIKMTPVKLNFNINKKRETIFELYGRMARTYLLKEDERIVDIQKDKLVVANCSADKNKLYKRLIRYDLLCKIIHPSCDVEEFNNFLKKALDKLT